MPTNQELRERHQRVTPSWLAVYHDEPIAIDHGEGRTVWDVEGNKYLDFFGGILTTMVGHNVPEITAAVQDQAAKILHSSTLYLSEPMIELAEMVTEMSGIPDAKVFFTTSGTEANDAALLLATSYRKSNQIIALRNSYHGRSFTAIAITSHRSWSPTGYSGLNAGQTTLDHIAFAVSAKDYETERSRLEQCGLTVDTTEHAWVRWRSLYVTDPEGNRVEFVCFDDTIAL